MIKLKRAYEPAKRTDGYRVLVDRLWPRGLKKADCPLDEWAKELAPSTELRKAFGHDPGNWSRFQQEYKQELRSRAAAEKLRSLADHARFATVTLVYSAHDELHNNAVVLKQLIDKAAKSSKPVKKSAA